MHTFALQFFLSVYSSHRTLNWNLPRGWPPTSVSLHTCNIPLQLCKLQSSDSRAPQLPIKSIFSTNFPQMSFSAFSIWLMKHHQSAVWFVCLFNAYFYICTSCKLNCCFICLFVFSLLLFISYQTCQLVMKLDSEHIRWVTWHQTSGKDD